MTGTSRTNGELIPEDIRISQAVSDILTTPIGSRVMRGDYGSHLFDLLDQPGTAATMQKARAAAVDALKKWEPAVTVSAVNVAYDGGGSFSLNILDDGQGLTYSATISQGI